MSEARKAAERIVEFLIDEEIIHGELDDEDAAIALRNLPPFIEEAIAAETEKLRAALLGYIETHGMCTLALRKIKAALEQKGGE